MDGMNRAGDPENWPADGPLERGHAPDDAASGGGMGAKFPKRAATNAEIQAVSRTWWTPVIERICKQPARALGVLYSFGQRLVNERASRLPPGIEGRAIAHDAIASALAGALAPPVSGERQGCAGRGEGGKDNSSSSVAPLRGRAAELAEDEILALRALCKRMANDTRGTSRTRTRRDQMRLTLSQKQTTGPEDRAAARIDLFAAAEKLPEKQKRACLEIEINGRDIGKFAKENGIAIETARTHLKLARRKLRQLLEDYDPDARDAR